MPVHILIECPELIVSARLGVLEPLRPLEQQGKCKLLFIKTMDIRKRHILWADIVITVRGCEALTLEVVRAAKEAGRFIIYYLDDDLLNIPKESTAWEYYNDHQLREDMLSLLYLSDVLWGVNPLIRDKYLHLTNGRWIENNMPCNKVCPPLKQTSKETIKVLYAGSTDHQTLVEDILTPVVRRLTREYGASMEFTFIGADPKIEQSEHIHYLPFISPYEQYRAVVEDGGFCIGLAPGRDDLFYSCKYYNKFVEYTSLGAVGVYSDAAPYTHIVEDGKNGILCRNDEQSWYQGIRRLADDPALLERCRAYSQEQLRRDFEPESIAQSLEAQCQELTGFHAPHVEAHLVEFTGGAFGFYWGRTKMIWRSRGIWSIPLIIYKAIKVIFKQGIARVYNFVR